MIRSSLLAQLLVLLFAAVACVGERPRNTAPAHAGLLPFKGVQLDSVQQGLVDGCAQTADPRHASPPEQVRDYCACTVVNRQWMLSGDSDPRAGGDVNHAFAAKTDQCRCAVGMKPLSPKGCADSG